MVITANRPAGEEAILQILDRVSERGTSIVGCGQRSQTFLFNYVPKDPRGDKGPIRETSPDLEELQAQIDAIKYVASHSQSKLAPFTTYIAVSEPITRFVKPDSVKS